MRTHLINLVIFVPLALGSHGCRSTSNRVQSKSLPIGVKTFVFAADGAGNYQDASENLKETIASDCLPIHAQTVEWSHGFMRMLADQTHYCHAVDEGRKLAQTLTAYRQKYPHARINLMGHSAGCIVVVKALEFAPPNTVDRLVMLAPSLSTSYDLRPSLHNVREGIDVFTSKRDWLYMKLYMRLVGTSDRKRTTGAGYGGFQPVAQNPGDLWLYQKLCHHPWRPTDKRIANKGGHFGPYQPDFLRVRVIPLFLGCNSCPSFPQVLFANPPVSPVK